MRVSRVYRLVAPSPPGLIDRIVILSDVQIQEMGCGHVLVAFHAAVDVRGAVVDVVGGVGCEVEGLAVGG